MATVRVESSAPTCNRLVRRVRVMAEIDYVMIENLVDKQRAALNPDPGKGGPGGPFAQRGNKEAFSSHFRWPCPKEK